MTITIKQAEINGIYISIGIDKFSDVYNVSAFQVFSNNTCGYPITSLTYTDIKKASRRFNTLCKKAKENTL